MHNEVTKFIIRDKENHMFVEYFNASSWQFTDLQYADQFDSVEQAEEAQKRIKEETGWDTEICLYKKTETVEPYNKEGGKKEESFTEDEVVYEEGNWYIKRIESGYILGRVVLGEEIDYDSDVYDTLEKAKKELRSEKEQADLMGC